jgi:hypothetical protein
MNIALWILAGLLAVPFFGAGVGKLTQPKADLAAGNMAWVEDGTATRVGDIGFVVPSIAVARASPVLKASARNLVPGEPRTGVR